VLFGGNRERRSRILRVQFPEASCGGRGVLTQRDRAILLREERASRQEDTPLPPLPLNIPGILESPKLTNVEQSKDQGLSCLVLLYTFLLGSSFHVISFQPDD